MKKPRKCPTCGSTDVIEIVYGYPSYEAFIQAEKGEIKLGGCCIDGDSPKWYCKR